MSATSSLLDQLYEAPVVQRLREQSFNRAIAHIDHQTSVSDHHVVREQLVNELIEELHRVPAPDLLVELRGLGLLWSVIAQIVGVTDAAIRKWRKGDSIDSTHYSRLARLVALARLYGTYTVPESPTAFGEWLDRRVVPRFSASPSQLLALSRDNGSSRAPAVTRLDARAPRRRAHGGPARSVSRSAVASGGRARAAISDRHHG